jgi:hypothetical protein
LTLRRFFGLVRVPAGVLSVFEAGDFCAFSFAFESTLLTLFPSKVLLEIGFSAVPLLAYWSGAEPGCVGFFSVIDREAQSCCAEAGSLVSRSLFGWEHKGQEGDGHLQAPTWVQPEGGRATIGSAARTSVKLEIRTCDHTFPADGAGLTGTLGTGTTGSGVESRQPNSSPDLLRIGKRRLLKSSGGSAKTALSLGRSCLLSAVPNPCAAKCLGLIYYFCISSFCSHSRCLSYVSSLRNGRELGRTAGPTWPKLTSLEQHCLQISQTALRSTI